MRRTRTVVGGLVVDDWIDLWNGCHNGVKQWAWPDGRPLMEQPEIVVRVFDVITERVLKEAQRE